MSRLLIKREDLIETDKVIYQVINVDKLGVTARTIYGDRGQTSFTHNELVKRYFNLELKIVPQAANRLPKGVQENLYKTLDQFSERDQLEAMRRYEYVIACDDRFRKSKASKAKHRYKRRPEGYREIAKVVARLRRIKSSRRVGGVSYVSAALESVSGSTLRDWYWRYHKAGKNIVALVPLHDKKGSEETLIDVDVMAIVKEYIEKFWLNDNDMALKHVLEAIENEIALVNTARATKLEAPSYTWLRQWVKRIYPEYVQTHHRKGGRTANVRFKIASESPATSRPGQEVEVDSTPLDLLCVEQVLSKKRDRRRKKEEKKTQRLWLTAVICTTTRVLLGWYINTHAPNWISVMSALQMAIQKKDSSLWNAETAHPGWGLLDLIKVDNGKAETSNSLKAFAASIGAGLRWMARGRGEQKGHVERKLGTVNQDFASYMLGRTFRDTRERAKRPSEERAAHTLEEIRATFGRWVCDIYHKKDHRALYGRSPFNVWTELEEAFGVRPAPTYDDLLAFSGVVLNRRITKDGITYAGLKYRRDELEQLHKSGGHIGKEYLIRANPLDISKVNVLDPDNGEWLDVPALDQVLTAGLTLADWQEIVEMTKREVDASEAVSRADLCAARNRFLKDAAAKGLRHRPMTQEAATAFDRQMQEMFDVKRLDYDGSPGQSTTRHRYRQRKHDQKRQERAEVDSYENLPQVGKGLPTEESLAAPETKRGWKRAANDWE